VLKNGHTSKKACKAFEQRFKSATYALYQDLKNPPSCTQKYEHQTPVEKGMNAGAERFEKTHTD
jgi:hypothetical protein